MLRGDGNENGQKIQRRSSLISRRKKKIFTCSTPFLCISLPFTLFSARLQRETSRNLLVTRFMNRGSVVCGPVHFSFAASHFYLGGRWHFSFPHRRYKTFLFFLQRNRSPLFFFISRSNSFPDIHVNVDINI